MNTPVTLTATLNITKYYGEDTGFTEKVSFSEAVLATAQEVADAVKFLLQGGEYEVVDVSYEISRHAKYLRIYVKEEVPYMEEMELFEYFSDVSHIADIREIAEEVANLFGI